MERDNKSRKIFAHVLNYGMNDLLLLLIPFVTIPLLSNHYGREAYGTFMLSKVIATSLGVLVDVGYRNVGIVGLTETKSLQEYFHVSTSLKFWIFISVGFVYLLVTLIFGLDSIFVILFLANIEFILIPRYLLIAKRWLTLMSKVFFVIAFLQIGGVLYVISHGHSIQSVALVFSSSYLVAGLLCFGYIKRKESDLVTMGLLTSLKVPEGFDQNKFYLGKNILGILKDKLAYFVTAGFVGNAAILEIDIGLRLINLLIRPFGIVNNLMIRNASANKLNRTYFNKQLKSTLVVAIMFVAITILLVPKLLPIIFVEDINYMPIGILVVSLVFLSFTTYVNSNILVLHKKTKDVFYSSVIVSIFYLGILGLLLSLNISEIISITISILSTYFVEALVAYYFKVNVRWSER